MKFAHRLIILQLTWCFVGTNTVSIVYNLLFFWDQNAIDFVSSSRSMESKFMVQNLVVLVGQWDVSEFIAT